MEQKFYICQHCGKIVAIVRESGVPVVCCGQKMQEIVPGTTEAAVEKHVPFFYIQHNKVYVTVGEVEHPMVPEHYIEWVSLQTNAGNQRKALKPGDKPQACFALCDGEEVQAIYAYCNLHSLWKTEVEEAQVCELKLVNTGTNENYIVCSCNGVTYFDILDAVHGNSNMRDLLAVFDKVRDTTKCSTGCGGCYDKVIKIISEAMHNSL